MIEVKLRVLRAMGGNGKRVLHEVQQRVCFGQLVCAPRDTMHEQEAKLLCEALQCVSDIGKSAGHFYTLGDVKFLLS